jgi:hypothetical protein
LTRIATPAPTSTATSTTTATSSTSITTTVPTTSSIRPRETVNASTIYHALPPSRAKQVFRVIDHVPIYLLIAGTYTPFTLGVLRGVWGWTLFGMVWSLAAAGIVFKPSLGFRYPRGSTVFYLLMGWVAVARSGRARRRCRPPASPRNFRLCGKGEPHPCSSRCWRAPRRATRSRSPTCGGQGAHHSTAVGTLLDDGRVPPGDRDRDAELMKPAIRTIKVVKNQIVGVDVPTPDFVAIADTCQPIEHTRGVFALRPSCEVYRRLASRIGKAKAVTATARKLAVLFSNSLRFGMRYVDPGQASHEERYQTRILANLTRRAKQLGYALVKNPEIELGVS